MTYEWNDEFISSMRMAEKMHPVFCGFDAILGEIADLFEAKKNGNTGKFKRELIHLAVVALRMHEELSKGVGHGEA